jgi:hypothetical protein
MNTTPRGWGFLTLLFTAIAVANVFEVTYMRRGAGLASVIISAVWIPLSVGMAFRWGQSVEAAKHAPPEPTA